LIQDDTDGKVQKARNYIEVLAEMAREPFLILDKDLRVVDVNDSFLQTFQVTREGTIGKYYYDLVNNQLDVAKLKELLEGILPKKKFFQGYEIEYNSPTFGKRIMMLNAQEVDSAQLIVLCFEDITARKDTENKSAVYAKGLEDAVADRTKALSDRVKDLEELTQVMVGRELKMAELKKEIIRVKALKDSAVG
jgi:two-component system CheB/CheR fusion protein